MRTKGNKTTARSRVRSALKSGKLKKLPCRVCGLTIRLQAHHPDYSKPLKIIWLCADHHYELHQKERPPHKRYCYIAFERHTAAIFKKKKPLGMTNTEYLASLIRLTK